MPTEDQAAPAATKKTPVRKTAAPPTLTAEEHAARRDAEIREDGNVRQRMAAVAREIDAVAKTQQNTDQKYSFRGIDDFLNSLHPILARYEVGVEPRYKVLNRLERPTRSGGTMTYVIVKGTFRFTAPDGSTVKVRTIGEGADTSDKATNKAMTAALKYALIQTFTVPTKDMDDGDRRTIEQAPMPTREELMKRLDAVGTKLGMPREDVTKQWRKRHGDISLEAFENLEPEHLLQFVVAAEQHVDTALEQQKQAKADESTGGYS